MVCHICLSDDVNKKIDRLDLCVSCYNKVRKELDKKEKEEIDRCKDLAKQVK